MDTHLLRAWEGERPNIVEAEGVELIDDQGRRYLDAASGVGVTALGYTNPEIVEAMAEQAARLPYAHALRFATQPAEELAAVIAAMLPGDLDAVFFTSGGSEATESAIKLARQLGVAMGHEAKWKVIGRVPSYHGNTIASLAAGWHAGRRTLYAPLLPPFPHVPAPNLYRGCELCREQTGCTLACAEELEHVIQQEGPETIAAFIAEPVVGAAGGALIPPSGYFAAVRAICRQYDVLLIADEVLTGFGRLGRTFGIEHFDVVPDILTFGKAVAAGYAPLAGLSLRRPLADTLGRRGPFVHHFTMSAHPVACAAGLTAQRIMQERQLVERGTALEKPFLSALARHAADAPLVGNIRGIGLLAGIELVRDRETKEPFPASAGMAGRAARLALDNGVVVYPGSGGVDGGEEGDYLLVMPPLVSTEEELEAMASRLGRALMGIVP